MVEALLLAAFENHQPGELESVHQQRIASVMDQINRDDLHRASDSKSEVAKAESSRRGPVTTNSKSGWRRWMSWSVAVAAVLVLLLFVQSMDTSRQAMAAIDRSLQAAKTLVTRKYRLTATKQDSQGNSFEVVSDLYVNGSQRFALRHPSPRRSDRSFWLGCDGKDSWFVPVIGPIRVGDDTGLGRWLRERESLSTPILQIETLLARMKDGYRLSQQPNQSLTLDDRTEVDCQHIVGIRKDVARENARENAPDKIELWCDVKTGIAIRLEVTRNAPVATGKPEQLKFFYLNSNNVPEDWFTPAGHSGRQRRVLRFDSNDETFLEKQE